MRKLYERSELTFALAWIVVYSIANSAANPLTQAIGIQYFVHAAFCIALTVLLFVWLKRNGLLQKYGLCKPSAPARSFLWYIPLVIIVSQNFWNGVAVNFPAFEALCYISYMLCVGFLEEVLFRGLLFRAIAKDNIKTAIIVSSVTFGLGHLLNLVNGSGMELVANLCQVVGAIAIGFLFVLIFYRGGSLLPCIIAHSAIDVFSAFANEAGLTAERRMLFSAVWLVIVVAYALILMKTLPKKQGTDFDGGACA